MLQSHIDFSAQFGVGAPKRENLVSYRVGDILKLSLSGFVIRVEQVFIIRPAQCEQSARRQFPRIQVPLFFVQQLADFYGRGELAVVIEIEELRQSRQKKVPEPLADRWAFSKSLGSGVC
ncbi:hypothetical protein ACVMII_006614 [Bradyrhizobium diazoefficiens]